MILQPVDENEKPKPELYSDLVFSNFDSTLAPAMTNSTQFQSPPAMSSSPMTYAQQIQAAGNSASHSPPQPGQYMYSAYSPQQVPVYTSSGNIQAQMTPMQQYAPSQTPYGAPPPSFQTNNSMPSYSPRNSAQDTSLLQKVQADNSMPSYTPRHSAEDTSLMFGPTQLAREVSSNLKARDQDIHRINANLDVLLPTNDLTVFNFYKSIDHVVMSEQTKQEEYQVPTPTSACTPWARSCC